MRLSSFVRVAVCSTALVFAAASSSSRSNNPSGPVTVPTAPANSVFSQAYDVRVNLPPSVLTVENGADGGWTAKTQNVYNGGIVTISVLIDREPQDAWTLADALRRDSIANNKPVTEISQATILGIPAAQWLTGDEQIATMVVLAKTGPCVYLLVAATSTTDKSGDDVVNFFRWAQSVVTTHSGGAAVNPTACH
jgi:hypothetical protein